MTTTKNKAIVSQNSEQDVDNSEIPTTKVNWNISDILKNVSSEFHILVTLTASFTTFQIE